jgi:hypothetical protein
VKELVNSEPIRLENVAAGLGNQRRVGSHAINEPGVDIGLDFVDVGAVEENFHVGKHALKV